MRKFLFFWFDRILSASIKIKPTKYTYMMNKAPRQKALGLPEDYPYNWFLGGVDTCGGDSGGPLWTNIKVGHFFLFFFLLLLFLVVLRNLLLL